MHFNVSAVLLFRILFHFAICATIQDIFVFKKGTKDDQTGVCTTQQLEALEIWKDDAIAMSNRLLSAMKNFGGGTNNVREGVVIPSYLQNFMGLGIRKDRIGVLAKSNGQESLATITSKSNPSSLVLTRLFLGHCR